MAFKSEADRTAYWKANIRLVITLLVIWFCVSFGAGVLFADALNNIRLGGYKLGFWFAQQGAIYTFVILVFVYARKMGELDRKYCVSEDD